MKFSKIQKHTKGFTLVEIMVSVAIFTIIITVGVGSLVTMTGTYQVSQAQKKVHDGLNYALENMTREIRLGENYMINPGSGGDLSGEDGIGSSIGFTATDDRGYVQYFVQGGTLMMSRSGAATAPNGPMQPLTDNTEIIVNNLRFTVIGTDTYNEGDYRQPLVWIQIQAYAVNGDEDRETTVQTLVSQRTLDA